MLWDDFVSRTVEQGLTGVEFLSLIPGTVGATPVQNVGAYGQDVSARIVTIQAYDSSADKLVTLRGSDCGFGYRTSIFKTTERGRYFIVGVTFFLRKGNPQPPFYGAISQYCEQHGIQQLTPALGRQATISIRTSKLPDPAKVGNNGSFFANPIIDGAQFLDLQANYPNIAYWPVGEHSHVKLSAAWLIDQAGFKDFHDADTGMGTWATQPLVLINEHAQSTAQLLKFRQKIIDAVMTKFGVTLTQEPELLGE
jgi:UDP-N-acetylmuramate dehydrogenase